MPVAVEHLDESVQVLCGGDRRLFRIRALIDIPVLPQAVLDARAAHELPHALGLGTGQRGRLEGTFYEGNIGEI